MHTLFTLIFEGALVSGINKTVRFVFKLKEKALPLFSDS